MAGASTRSRRPSGGKADPPCPSSLKDTLAAIRRGELTKNAPLAAAFLADPSAEQAAEALEMLLKPGRGRRVFPPGGDLPPLP